MEKAVAPAQGNAVAEACARRADVAGAGINGANSILNQGRRRGIGDIVASAAAGKNKAKLVCGYAGILKRTTGRNNPHRGRRLVRGADAPLANPRMGENPLVSGVQCLLQITIRDYALRQIRANPTNADK